MGRISRIQRLKLLQNLRGVAEKRHAGARRHFSSVENGTSDPSVHRLGLHLGQRREVSTTANDCINVDPAIIGPESSIAK